jgi:hypothetical protein
MARPDGQPTTRYHIKCYYPRRYTAVHDAQSESRSAEKEAILVTLRRLLDTVAGRDKRGMSELLMPEGSATQSRDHQISHTQLRGFPERMPGGSARLEERFYNPVVHVADDIAVVYGKYDCLVDGEVHHWGTNTLSFVRQGAGWRISAIADTARTGSRPRDWGAA